MAHASMKVRRAELREVSLAADVPEVFARMCDRPGAFLLESAQHAGGLGEYSFFGCDPFLRFRARDGRVWLSRPGLPDSELDGDPLDGLRRLLQEHRCAGLERIPFAGGAVGFFSYEHGASLEKVKPSCPDDLRTADIDFGFYDGLVAVEHATRRAYLVASPIDGAGAEAIFRRLEAQLADSSAAPSRQPVAGAVRAGESRAMYSKNEYFAAVARIKDYIAAGDVYQVNLTQRFESALPCHPYELYRRLRRRSPAPFATYLNADPLHVVGSSPERFLRLKGGLVETRPIKGTRRRGADSREDARLAAELLASEKDRAELLMIVDLERNDLGRVCVPGSIAVEDLFKVETHPTLHHLVAKVSGRLREGCDVIDCLRALSPGGSITGAPKIRAMQIIDELEVTRRGIYTGAVGYLGFDGGCDLNIAIRTMICADGRVFHHAGGGIVWDSDPEAEYQETLDKGAAMRAALLGPGPDDE